MKCLDTYDFLMECFLLVSVNNMLHHIVFTFKIDDKKKYIKTNVNFKHNCEKKELKYYMKDLILYLETASTGKQNIKRKEKNTHSR